VEILVFWPTSTKDSSKAADKVAKTPVLGQALILTGQFFVSVFCCTSSVLLPDCAHWLKFMKSILLSIIAASILTSALSLVAQDAKKSDATDKSKDTPPKGATSDKPKFSQGELEAAFKVTLTKAILAGRWCSIKDGKLGPEKDDKYIISSVTKVGG